MAGGGGGWEMGRRQEEEIHAQTTEIMDLNIAKSVTEMKELCGHEHSTRLQTPLHWGLPLSRQEQGGDLSC